VFPERRIGDAERERRTSMHRFIIKHRREELAIRLLIALFSK